MSFSVELKKELSELSARQSSRQSCCKKALAWGILLDADHTPQTDEVIVSLPDAEIASSVRKLFSGVFGKAPLITEKVIVGRTRYLVTQTSRTAATMLDSWDAEQTDINGILTCAECRTLFVRGALIGCGAINDPQKESHLEFHFKHTTRAALLYPILTELGTPPKLVNRSTSCGLYYKNSGVIEDILLQCGAQQAGFEWINSKIKNEIRNTENRVTNCEAKNIQKVVRASQKYITAIRILMEQPTRWETLPEELRITARLRLENENASLQELIRLHNPPISKSGLNHRLEKLLRLAQEDTEKNT